MNDNAAVCGIILILMCYCVPMLKRMDELEKRIAKIETQLDHIEKALYVMPDDGGDKK